MTSIILKILAKKGRDSGGREQGGQRGREQKGRAQGGPKRRDQRGRAQGGQRRETGNSNWRNTRLVKSEKKKSN